MASRVTYEQYILNTNVKAFLQMIKASEGSTYNTLFGGGTFSSYAAHPNIAVTRGGYTSTAAGAYQFLYATWNGIKNVIGAGDFSPRNQDIGASRLLESRGAINYIKQGKLSKAIYKCAPEWASLPTISGKSYYPQPVRGMQFLRNAYLMAGGIINEDNSDVYKDDPVVTDTKAKSSSSSNQSTNPQVPESTPEPRPDRSDNSKDIVTVKDKIMKLPDLKLWVDDDTSSVINKAEFTGSMTPFIVYNNYTFSYDEITNFTLTYQDYYPKLTFSIDDSLGRFNTLHLPKETDTITLYLKPHTDKYKPIYIVFEIENTTSNNSIRYFNCILKLPKLFTEASKAFKSVTSYDTFLQVATDLELGFNTNVDNTKDLQTRIIAKETYLNFMKREIKDSYKDDKSFFSFFIDFYYNLNFVDLNNQFGEYGIQDTIISIMDDVEDEKWANGEEIKINGDLILSNSNSIAGTTSFITDYKLLNNAGLNKNENGHLRIVQFYDTDLESFESHEIKPNYETIGDTAFRSDGGTDDKKKIIKSTYLGIQQTKKNTANVHDNQKFARLNNFQNLQEIDKMYLVIELGKPNFHIYRYQSIPVSIFENRRVNVDLSGLSEYGKQRAKARGEDVKNDEAMLPQYSGHYVVENITYTYNIINKDITQTLKLMRREWPKSANQV